MKKETIVNKLKDFDFRLDNEVLVENMENYIALVEMNLWQFLRQRILMNTKVW